MYNTKRTKWITKIIKTMETTQIIIWIIGGIGAILDCVFLYQMIVKKVNKSTWTLFAIGQMLITPSATINLLTKSGMLWKIIFGLILLSGIIAIIDIASDSKKK